MAGINGLLYKAYGGQGATALIPTSYAGKIGKVQYVTDSGKVYSTKMQTAGSSETGAYKFNFGASPEELGPGKVQLILDDGTVLEQPIQSSTNDFRNGKEVAPQNQNSGPGGAAGGGGGSPGTYSGPGQFAPGYIGYGAYPSYLGKEYPDPVLTGFNPISDTRSRSAPFNFTDPQAYAAKFGDFNRSEVVKNFDLSKDLALGALDTELAGLTSFVPAASALKRSETSLDNAFNQSERTKAVDSALPGVRADLDAQAGRARTFAEGKIPDSIADRGLELSTRGAAADAAYSGGFGANSSAARSVSDLASAETRVQLSQYGDQLLGKNIDQKTSLFLAPTEYSNAGSQVQVTPQTNAGVTAINQTNQLNEQTLISPTNALSSTVGQNQFTTNLEQQTRENNATRAFQTKTFNASNTLQNSQFNATNQNNFALGKFQYDVSYAGAVAGAGQTNINTQTGLQMQLLNSQIFSDYLAKAQATQQTGAIAQGLAALLPQLAGAITSIAGLFKSDPAKTAGGVPTIPSGTQPVSSDTNSFPDSSIFPTGITDGSNHGGPSGSIYVPNGETLPDGFYPVASTGTGTIAIPDTASVDSFMSDFS